MMSAVPAAAAAAPANAAAEQAAQAQYDAAMAALKSQLHPQSGTVTIPAAKARLNLGDQYYFLPADEARRVLTEAWGNPPESVGGVLGMVFPAGKSFNDKTWGAVLAYESTGHVKDEDAATEDYDSVLSDLRSAEEEDNKARTQQGYPVTHTIGWAQAPTYDAQSKTLIWARNIKFEGQDENTLNYDVRTLSRDGVLSLNMVDTMANLASVRTAAAGLGSTVVFDAGARYADFNPSTDKLADYGLAGLVAGGVGLAVAKKAGFLAIALLFLKKFFVLILAGIAGIGAWFRKRFGQRYNESDYDPEA